MTTPPKASSSRIDADRDISISSINCINDFNSSALAAIMNAFNFHDKCIGKTKDYKPPAISRSEEKFQSLRSAGKYTRFMETSRWFKKFLNFT